jgi:hypothetical protein
MLISTGGLALVADRLELCAIFVGGAAGAGARTALSELAPAHPGHWPWVTWDSSGWRSAPQS